ncbi:pentapeptide repeat-containing protein [Euzebya tangerina]|uniref:pentapeptide repeat-containing protein n=1 Tax=Euzebya tangerina TaxID=591198 RepID=UPI000E316B22|nr:pentapeptide repeat-containing protein [Euzebya tangerina]
MRTRDGHDGEGPTAPAPVEPDVPVELRVATSLRAGDDLDGVRLPQPDLAGAGLGDVRLTRFELDTPTLDGATVTDALLADGRVIEMSGTSLALVGTRVRDVVLDGGRVGALDAHDAHLLRVHLRGLRLGFVNLRGSRVEDVVAEDCIIDELDLGLAEVARMAFRSCRIDRFVAVDASLADVDLRGTELGEVGSPTDLRGCTISPAQLTRLAPALAAHVGVDVRDGGTG